MFDNLKNTIDFYIREKTKFSRKNFVEKNKKMLLRADKENEFFLDLFKKYFKQQQKESIKVLDIGSKNFYYIKSMHNFFSSFSNNFQIDGVEIDAYRLYLNFYSRFEAAKFYIKEYDNVNYIPDDLMNINEKYDYITWFLPFLYKKTQSYWGLPNKFFKPKEMLKHAYSLLNPCGEMLVMNQTKDEYDKQISLYEELGYDYLALNEVENNYFECDYPRFLSIVYKK